jgi:hypothetical protein
MRLPSQDGNGALQVRLIRHLTDQERHWNTPKVGRKLCQSIDTDADPVFIEHVGRQHAGVSWSEHPWSVRRSDIQEHLETVQPLRQVHVLRNECGLGPGPVYSKSAASLS